MKTVDFSETIAASDLKFSRSRHLIEYMKVWSIEGQGHFLTLAQGRVQCGQHIFPTLLSYSESTGLFYSE